MFYLVPTQAFEMYWEAKGIFRRASMNLQEWYYVKLRWIFETASANEIS